MLRVPSRRWRPWRGEFRRALVAIKTCAGVARGADMRPRRGVDVAQVGVGRTAGSTVVDVRARRARSSIVRTLRGASSIRSNDTLCRCSSDLRTRAGKRTAADAVLRRATEAMAPARANTGRNCTSDACVTRVALQGSGEARM
eukprot:6209799-Pleurochrysis_carterae.AAC.1